MEPETLETKVEEAKPETLEEITCSHAGCAHNDEDRSAFYKAASYVYGDSLKKITTFPTAWKESNIMAKPLISAIYSYRVLSYPLYRAMDKITGRKVVGCVYEPSCSQYMVEAIQKKGIFKGIAKGFWRIMRCNPWSKGGYDPVEKDK